MIFLFLILVQNKKKSVTKKNITKIFFYRKTHFKTKTRTYLKNETKESDFEVIRHYCVSKYCNYYFIIFFFFFELSKKKFYKTNFSVLCVNKTSADVTSCYIGSSESGGFNLVQCQAGNKFCNVTIDFFKAPFIKNVS